MGSLIGYLLASFFVLILLLVFKVGMLHQNLLIYDKNLAGSEEHHTRLLCGIRSDEPNARSICNGDIVKANPNPLETMALLLRGPGNAAGHGQTITTELFLNRDCNENIDQLRIKAPVGSRLAWRINKKVRIQQPLSLMRMVLTILLPVCAWYNCLITQ